MEKTSKELLETAFAAPKKSRIFEDYFYDEGENGSDVTVNYSFELSGDFLVGKCNAGEIDFYAVYEPLSDEEYASGAANPEFYICSAAEDMIYDLIEEYKYGGVPEDVREFERVSGMGEKVYFKAALDIYKGKVLYFYAMDRGKSMENNYMGVLYNEDIVGTELEKKILGELKEAVRSYTER